MVISTRKRKMMISKLNNYFKRHGRILTETEYMQMGDTPFRIGTIKKFLRSWPGMVAYMHVVYPEWEEKKVKAKPAPVKPVEPEVNPLEALRAKKREETSDEDE